MGSLDINHLNHNLAFMNCDFAKLLMVWSLTCIGGFFASLELANIAPEEWCGKDPFFGGFGLFSDFTFS